MNKPIKCAIQTPDGIHTVTVVKEGEISTVIPLGVDITSTVSTSIPSNYGIFYVLSSAPDGPQGIVVENDGLGFEIYTYDGYNLTFKSSDGEVNNGGGIGGPNDASCPLHTDAKWTGIWEELTFTRVLNQPENSNVPPGAIPYYIQTKSEYYLESVKDSYNSKNQPVYKSNNLENTVVLFIPIVKQE